MIRVSVIIPVYEAEDRIRRCVESVLANREIGMEILLVEDGSCDRSWEICAAYAEKYPEIRAFRNEKNQGVAYTRNRGLTYARGKYIVFVDSDDWMEDTCLSQLLAVAERDALELVLTGYSNHEGKNGENSERFMWEEEAEESRINLRRELKNLYEKRLLCPVWNKLFLRHILVENDIFFVQEFTTGEDIHFVLRYISAMTGTEAVCMNRIAYHYMRDNPYSLMRKLGKRDLEVMLGAMKEMYLLMGEKPETLQGRMEEEEERQKRQFAYMILHNPQGSFRDKRQCIRSLVRQGGERLFWKQAWLYVREWMVKKREKKKGEKKLEIRERAEPPKAVWYPDAVLLPRVIEDSGPGWGLGGVCDRKGRYISQSFYEGGWISHGGTYEWDRKQEEYFDDDVIYLGLFFHHWGHFLVDLAGRLWYPACSSEYHSEMKLAYLGEEELDGNYLEFLQLLHVKETQLIHVTKPLRCRHVIVPEVSVRPCRWYRSAYREIFDTAIRQAMEERGEQPVWGKKIYLTRRQLLSAQKQEFGEAMLEQIFQANGYECVAPELLSVREQIYLWNDAEEIVCINGTLSLNLIFSQRRNQRWIFLNKSRFFHANLYFFLHIRGRQAEFVDVYREPFPFYPRSLGKGPFLMGPGVAFRKWARRKKLWMSDISAAFVRDWSVSFWQYVSCIGKEGLQNGRKRTLLWGGALKKMHRRRAFLYAYDQTNLGDDLFIRLLARRYPQIKFYVWADRKRGKRFQREKNLRFLEPNPGWLQKIRSRKPEAAAIYEHMCKKVCGLVIDLGGSIFVEYPSWKDMVHWWEYQTEHYPVCVLGANFGPYHTKEYYLEMKRIMEKLQDICLRDRYSYELLRGKGQVRYAPDLLFSYPLPKVKQKKRQLFVSLIHCERKEQGAFRTYEEKYEEILCQILACYLEQKERIVLAAFCRPEGDEEAARKIKERFRFHKEKEKIVILSYDGRNEEKLLYELAASEYVIATRFHAILLSLAARQRVYPILYSEKSRHMLEDVGFQGNYLELEHMEKFQMEQVLENEQLQQAVDLKRLMRESGSQFAYLDQYFADARSKRKQKEWRDGKGYGKK